MSFPAVAYSRTHRERFLAELITFLAIPSISTLSESRGAVQRGAEWVADKLRAIGLEHVEITPTGGGAGQPLVYADWLHAPNAPTILVYGHYDVQPVDPLDEWLTPPFEPTIIGDLIYARGASDMKGQTLAFISALEALLQTNSLRKCQGHRRRGGRNRVAAFWLFFAGTQGEIELRRGAERRFANGDARPAGHRIRLARLGVFRDMGTRSGARPSFRFVRRQCAQSRAGAVRAAGGDARCRRASDTTGVLRRCAGPLVGESLPPILCPVSPLTTITATTS